jgi:2'-5' RNA ligase
MSLPPMVRVFFAIDLPVSVKEAVGSYIRALKKSSKSQAIRWTKPENLHITLQFLAEVQSEHIAKLAENARKHLDKEMQAISLSFGSVQLFPSLYRPRVIVLDIGPQDQLSELSGWIGEGIMASNYPVEARPFRAHLTLGRIKHPHGLNLSFLSELSKPSLGNIAINEVTLFRSQPQEDGSHYSVLEKIDLRVKKLAS